MNVEIGDYPFEIDPRWVRKDGTVFNGMKLMEHSYSGNDYILGILATIENRPAHIAHVGDYADCDSDFGRFYTKRIYDMAWGDDYAESVKVFDAYNPKAAESGFVVNHTKGIYYDIDHANDENDEHICPLMILCAVGNGRGGGDYRGFNEDKAGSWAMDVIEYISDRDDIPVGFTEVSYHFSEGLC